MSTSTPKSQSFGQLANGVQRFFNTLPPHLIAATRFPANRRNIIPVFIHRLWWSCVVVAVLNVVQCEAAIGISGKPECFDIRDVRLNLSAFFPKQWQRLLVRDKKALVFCGENVFTQAIDSRAETPLALLYGGNLYNESVVPVSSLSENVSKQSQNEANNQNTGDVWDGMKPVITIGALILGGMVGWYAYDRICQGVQRVKHRAKSGATGN